MAGSLKRRETSRTDPLESYEALPGTKVRISEGTRRTEFTGMWGAIERSFGSPEHPALDVRLENGRRELFWFYQLDSSEDTWP